MSSRIILGIGHRFQEHLYVGANLKFSSLVEKILWLCDDEIDETHLYTFFVGDKRIVHPEAIGYSYGYKKHHKPYACELDATKCILRDYLKKDDKFELLYDFGSEQRFDIKVINA